MGEDDDVEFFTVEQLKQRGFTSVGKGCRISALCRFYGTSGTIGDDVRIDDFCIIKGNVELGNHVHICAYSMLSGVGGKILLRDHTVLAARCSVYTGSNDHGSDAALGAGCTGVPPKYTAEIFGPVTVCLGALVGAHCVILPGTTIGVGATVGAGCIVTGEIPNGAMIRSGAKTWTADRRRDWMRINGMAKELEYDTR